MSNWLASVWIWIQEILVVLSLSILYGDSCLLVSWCAGDRCDMAGSDENHGKSRRDSAEDWGWSSQVGNSVPARSRGRVTLCVVCTMHKEMRSAGFLVRPQNKGRRFLPVWPQNRWLRVSRFGPQNWQLRFGDMDIKIITTVSWFRPQNQAGYGLLAAPQNQQRIKTAWNAHRDLAACFTWEEVGLEFPRLTSRLAEARSR
jgi:hypothetical protein